MRIIAFASLLFLGLFASACDCSATGYEISRSVQGNIRWSGAARKATSGAQDWVGLHQYSSVETALVWFSDASTTPPALPGDLSIFPIWSSHSTTDSANAFVAPLGFNLMVHGVSAVGPAEIDLNDARATLIVGFSEDYDRSAIDGVVPHHGIDGHLSLTSFSAGSCPGGRTLCDLTLQGTFSFTATGENGELVSVTDGVISASKSAYQVDTCRQGQD